MDNSPIPGFITRRQASELCQRSERTLQRYWSRAIEFEDSAVLKHLKLRTEDGDVIEGSEVSKQLIEDLKKSSKNPTWYVHAAWAENTYRPRTEEKPSKEKSDANGEALAKGELATTDNEVVALLKDRIERLEQDKQDLRDELTIKNEQIGQASERDRETHLLMRDLHELLRDMQQRLPAQPQPSQMLNRLPPADESTDTTQPTSVVARSKPVANSEKGTGRSRTKAAPQKSKRSSAIRSKRSPAKPKSRNKRQSKPRWYETPTLNKFAARFIRSN